MKILLKVSAATAAIVAILGLSGCGGGGGGGGGGVPAAAGNGAASTVTSTGIITGFGSVFVNGVEFETAGSSFSLDDGDDGLENESELGVGMVVAVTGTVNPDGITGNATHIEYDDELEGIVISESIDDVTGTGTMDVMGQTVVVDEATIFESKDPGITHIGQIAIGHIVEISGYPTGTGTIFATRVELVRLFHTGKEIEVKGIIGNLAASTFTVGTLTVDFSTAQLDSSIPGGQLSEGLYVEVKSTAGLNGLDQLIASKIELESGGNMDFDGVAGDVFEISGLVTDVTLAGGVPREFEIGGKRLILTGTTLFKHGLVGDIKKGIVLEVHGELDATGVVVASNVEFKEISNIHLEGIVEAVSGAGASGTITVLGRTFTVTPDTIMFDEQDEGVMPVRFFGLDDLVATVDYVEIYAHLDSVSGDLIADMVARDDGPDDASTPEKLEGLVEAISIAGQLTVSGITVDVSGILGLPVISVGDEVEVGGSYNVGTMVFNAVSIEIDD